MQNLFDARLQTLQKRMTEEGYDLLLICADIYRPGNTAYFTGLHQCGAGTSQAWSILLVTQKDSTLFVGFEMVSEGRKLIPSQTKVERSDEIEKALRGIHVKNVGVIGLNILSVSTSEKLKAALRISDWQDASRLMNEQRIVKSAEEIQAMKAAFRASDEGFKAAISAVKEGASEKEIAAAAAIGIIQAGAKPGFWPMVHAGTNTGNAMQSPSDNVVKKDNIVMIDLGAYANGYYSDNTRTVLFQATTPKLIQVVQTCQEAMKAGFAAAKPGRPISEVEWAVRNVITENGFGEYIVHNVGHGIAYDAEEEMPIGPTSELIMREGMTFTVEPGIYIPNECGCRLEEAIYLTADGCEAFSQFPIENRLD